jgi:hypothetical protein
MGFDITLLLVVVGGIGLSAAYVRAEYIRWRKHRAAQRRREAALRELHTASLSDQQSAALLPSVLRLRGFSHGEAANPESSPNVGTSFGERRKRDRQRANQ